MQLHNSMGYLLNISARLIKRELDSRLAKYHLTTSQWAVLMVLTENNGLSQIELASKLNSDKATCGTILDKLIQKKLIEKRPSKKDKRSYLVFILPDTLTLMDSMIEEAILCNQNATKGFTEEEIKQYQKFLIATIKNLGGNLV